ncbi:SBBP repeat-containing protein [Marixanthomonas ophiurae]|uniref:T9SS C-terminal target domain-containing protein n=1 Tax=Marixanthomonas ophiurae TaxID=387659 RepID=A0A3E1Q8X4_9FLAO|nr:SBBP repeat-containing protein [Marixanthomonas ophiurae]RFN58572.1 T9SS C-terminal target domain-containing protein [Marixanthomonas ophiurae]
MMIKNYSVWLFCLCISFTTFAQSYEWGGRFGGAGEDVVKKMHVDAEGNSYVTGYFTDTADFDITNNESNLTSNGFYDVFVQKTNTEGNLEWAVSIGGAMFDYGTGITTDSQGNVYVTGYFDETVDFNPGGGEWLLTSQGGGDIFILKLTSNGEFVWAKSVGGTGYEESTSIDVDELGNVYILGYLYETVDFDPNLGEALLTSQGGSDTFLLQLDSAGNFVNVYSYGGEDLDLALDLSVKSSSELFISGYFAGTTDLDPRPIEEYTVTASGTGFAGYTMQIDETGAITNIALTEGGNINVYAIAYDTSNNMYITGNFDGTVNFAPASGSSEYTFTSNEAYNGFVLKVLADGSVAWAKHMASDNAYFTYDIVVGANENVYTTGYFSGTADFNPDPTEEFMLSNESTNPSQAFLLSLDSDGEFVSAYQFGGVGFIDTHQLGIDDENNIYLAAQFETTVDLNPLPTETEEVTSIDFRDNYLFKFIDGTLSTSTNKLDTIQVYPNPTTSRLRIQTTDKLLGEKYTIYNLIGQKIANGTLTENLEIPVDGLKSGLYVLTIANQNSFKFIKR